MHIEIINYDGAFCSVKHLGKDKMTVECSLLPEVDCLACLAM
jgi:hypothetical protein